ncbi:type II toxin-antitoxin system Phd/YefM family antitoxin [Thiothrix nivea]|jgi:PHD/YefM family antitoxin component YafN of YafNO toxin-antitoxin module|uniref:Antitoxin n=1 Tax=Thiothrix nivea (strain ATCC 35100 / DSM 5205 / JP2) TaxID=870187 RepID=A0A656HNT4_THINJ|nr:type II toxin-antitoxin system Phd/YefM family antitoxin [Thiothrix nivea]EIJ37020.1 prevent-host-death family protein [Thiothrix nivea DSM 5205]
MRQYNFTEARKNFASILETAKQEGIICIYKRNGEAYYLTPAKIKKSPLDVDGINLNLTSDQIVSIVRESRERNYF